MVGFMVDTLPDGFKHAGRPRIMVADNSEYG